MNLFDPIPLRGLVLGNRIVVSPMCQYSAADGCATDWHLVHWGQLLMSGAGLFTIEATAVTAEGRITPGCLGPLRRRLRRGAGAIARPCASAVPAHSGRDAACACRAQGVVARPVGRRRT